MNLEETINELQNTEQQLRVVSNEIERLRTTLLDLLTRKIRNFNLGNTLRITYKVSHYGEEDTLSLVSLIPDINYILDTDGTVTSNQGIVLNIYNISTNDDLLRLANAIKNTI